MSSAFREREPRLYQHVRPALHRAMAEEPRARTPRRVELRYADTTAVMCPANLPQRPVGQPLLRDPGQDRGNPAEDLIDTLCDHAVPPREIRRLGFGGQNCKSWPVLLRAPQATAENGTDSTTRDPTTERALAWLSLLSLPLAVNRPVPEDSDIDFAKCCAAASGVPEYQRSAVQVTGSLRGPRTMVSEGHSIASAGTASLRSGKRRSSELTATSSSIRTRWTPTQ